jgi:HAD superfamily hydrolase (TIGR01509 family)
MIRALLCDWGGVLMRSVDPRPRLAWERRLGLPPTALADQVFSSDAWQQAQHGQASLAEVWAEVGERLGLTAEETAALSHDFWAGDQIDQGLVALLRDLREQGLRLALLSNHTRELPRLIARLGLDGLFQEQIISATAGASKPDPAIYWQALERLGVAAEETVFVDDWGVNVAAARQLGLVGIRFRGVAHLRRALAAAGLPVTVPSPDPVPGIRAVIFDWGGVLSPLTFVAHIGEWERRLGLAEGTLDRVLWGTTWKRLEIGEITQEEYDAHVARGLGLPGRAAVRRFYREFYADERIEPWAMPLVRGLRGKYRVALLSNAFPGQAEHTQKKHGVDLRAEFDLYINSAEVGLAKPDPAIYLLALNRLGVAPQEAVFLDDQLRNVDAAQLLGMHGLVYTDPETGLADLSALLGIPLPV